MERCEITVPPHRWEWRGSGEHLENTVLVERSGLQDLEMGTPSS